MGRVKLHIEDPALRVTLETILRSGGHEIANADADVVIAGSAEDAIRAAQHGPALVVAAAGDIPEAVRAMRQGVYGYIFLPLQPGETDIMVQRAIGGGVTKEEPELLSLPEVERRHIEKVLRHCRHNRTEAARILGIGRNTLWRKLRDS